MNHIQLFRFTMYKYESMANALPFDTIHFSSVGPTFSFLLVHTHTHTPKHTNLSKHFQWLLWLKSQWYSHVYIRSVAVFWCMGICQTFRSDIVAFDLPKRLFAFKIDLLWQHSFRNVIIIIIISKLKFRYQSDIDTHAHTRWEEGLSICFHCFQIGYCNNFGQFSKSSVSMSLYICEMCCSPPRNV